MDKVVGYGISAVISFNNEPTDEQTNEMLDRLADVLQEYGAVSVVLKPLKDFEEK